MFLTSNGITASHGPADDFWYQPAGTMTASGVRVSPEMAMRLTVVFACVRVAAETVGHLPLHLHRRLDNGGKERATDHPLYSLLHDQPNSWQTSMEWREQLQGHVELRGNHYSEIIYAPNGRIVGLVPLNPDCIKIDVIDNAGRFRYVYAPPGGTERILSRGQVFQVRGLSSDGLFGLSPIELEREAVGEALAAQGYGAAFYRNGATMPGWIEFPGQFKDADARNKFRETYQAAQSDRNRFKTPVFDMGMKYHELGIKHTDAQFLETRKYKDSDIARIFRIPPHKVGILDKATFSNIEQQAIEFVTDSMIPRLRRIEQALNRDLLRDDERDEYFFEFAVDGLLRGDAKARADFYSRGILDGWLTRNEVRISENKNPLQGLDKPLEPLNMVPAGQRDKPQGDSSRDASIRHAAAQRVVNKEVAAVRKAHQRIVSTVLVSEQQAELASWAAEFYEGHRTMVCDVMALSARASDAYCDQSCTMLIEALGREAETSTGAIAALLDTWETNKAAELARLGD